MATVLNLDEVVCQRTEITKTVAGQVRTWDLRDDIPAETMLLCFTLLDHVQQRSDSPAGDGDAEDAAAMLREVRTRLEEQIEETLAVCVAIWRHTYQETTADELRAWFEHSERERIVQLFFYRRLTGSSVPSSATTPETIAPTETESQEEKPNRAARRRKSTGGIPSQKRLARELKSL